MKATPTASPPVRLVLADDDELLRESLAYLIESQDDLHVVGQAANGQDAVDLARSLAVDVVVLDIRMPGIDGIEAVRLIKSRPSGPGVLMLTTFDQDEYVFDAFRHGADGFLLKRARPDDLYRAIRTVARGDALVDPEVTRALIGKYAHGMEPTIDVAAHFKLTEREIDVLTELAAGRSNPEIADRLDVTPQTVKSHLSSAFGKIQCKTRVQAVIFAYDAGLATPRPSRHIG